MNFSSKSSGTSIPLKIIVAQAVDAINKMLPRVKATKIYKMIRLKFGKDFLVKLERVHTGNDVKDEFIRNMTIMIIIHSGMLNYNDTTRGKPYICSKKCQMFIFTYVNSRVCSRPEAIGQCAIQSSSRIAHSYSSNSSSRP